MNTKDDKQPKVYSAEQVSQGYIALRTPLRKAIFFGGLIVAVILAAALGFGQHH